MKPTLVLVPGSLCTDEVFAPILPIDGVDVVCCAVPAAESISTMANDVMDVIGLVRGPVVVGGLSLGGLVAAEVAGRGSTSVVGLLVMDAFLGVADPDQVARRFRWDEAARAGRLLAIAEEQLAAATVNPMAHRELALRMAAATGPNRFLAQNRALRDRSDLMATVADCGLPTLLLWGEEDQLVSPERRREMVAAMPHATIRQIPAAGHLVTLDRPGAVRTEVVDWLGSEVFAGRNP
jgi:pimeloyl-ACP methyl ester carboxylesterase